MESPPPALRRGGGEESGEGQMREETGSQDNAQIPVPGAWTRDPEVVGGVA